MLLSCFSFHVFFYFGIRSERCCLEMCWKGREFGALGDWTTFPTLSGRPGPPFFSENPWDKEEKVNGPEWRRSTRSGSSPTVARAQTFTCQSWQRWDYRGGNVCPSSGFSNFPFFCDLFQDKFEGKPGKITGRKVNWVVTLWHTLGTRYKTRSLRSGHKVTHIHMALWAKVTEWRGKRKWEVAWC